MTDKEKFGEKHKEIETQLFKIVEQLNQKLKLGLENTFLNIHTNGENLEIHYWESRKAENLSDVTHDITILIDKNFTVTKYEKDLNTGETIFTQKTLGTSIGLYRRIPKKE